MIKEALEKGNYITLKINSQHALTIVNDDYTSSDDEEIQEIEEMLEGIKKLAKGKPYFISWVPEAEKYFSQCPDFYKKACEVVDLKLILLEGTDENKRLSNKRYSKKSGRNKS